MVKCAFMEGAEFGSSDIGTTSAIARIASIMLLIDDSNLFDIAKNSVVSEAVIRNTGLRTIVVGNVPMRQGRIEKLALSEWA